MRCQTPRPLVSAVRALPHNSFGLSLPALQFQDSRFAARFLHGWVVREQWHELVSPDEVRERGSFGVGTE